MTSVNNEQQNKNLFELYTLAELTYQNHFKNMVKSTDELYPDGWYENKNYKVKIEILSEAISTSTLIVDTQGYQKIIEGFEPKRLELS